MALKRTASEDIQVGPVAPGWMVTYGDLMTQILIFFVMMFALASAMNEIQLITLKRKMAQYIHRVNLEKNVSLNIDERGLVISFHGKEMYKKGADKINPGALSALENLSAFVRPQRNRVRIEGNTDLSETSEKYPSHWDLSAARASYISQLLVKKIYFPSFRLSVAGYADEQPYIRENGPTYKALLARRSDLLKTAADKFLHETKRMIARKIDEKVLGKRAEYRKKYASSKNARALERLAEMNYRASLARRYDRAFNKIRSDAAFKTVNGDWVAALAGLKLTQDEADILAGKENIIKAQYYDKLQREVVEMANLSPGQRDRNRRVDIIVARLSSQMGKKRLL